MDDRAFDRFTRLYGRAGSRRHVVRSLLGVVVAGVLPAAALAKERRPAHKHGHKGKDAGRGAKRKHRVRAQATSNCCSSGNCTPGPGKNLSKCCYDGADLTGANFKAVNATSANFSGADLMGANFGGANLRNACFVGADLSGARLTGATTHGTIFCHTTMPDGDINDSGCDNGTSCCPTCAGDCPPDPRTGEPGFCCPGGFCSCGGVCCAGPDCWVLTRQFETDPPTTASSESCQPPSGCVACPNSGDACCSSCTADGGCISSGPIGGGSIRRR